MSSGIQQSANQSEKFIARCNDVQSGCAATQRDELGFEPELIEVVQAQVGAAQSYPGEHGIVLAIAAVGCDMNQPAARALFPERCFIRFSAYEQLGIRQDTGDGP